MLGAAQDMMIEDLLSANLSAKAKSLHVLFPVGLVLDQQDMYLTVYDQDARPGSSRRTTLFTIAFWEISRRRSSSSLVPVALDDLKYDEALTWSDHYPIEHCSLVPNSKHYFHPLMNGI